MNDPNKIDVNEGREVSPNRNTLEDFSPTTNPSGKTIAERQETTRSKLANFLIYILAGTLIASFVLIITLTIMSGFIDKKKEYFDKTSSLVKDLITFILTAQTGLIGTALGFYFGSHKDNTD